MNIQLLFIKIYRDDLITICIPVVEGRENTCVEIYCQLVSAITRMFMTTLESYGIKQHKLRGGIHICISFSLKCYQSVYNIIVMINWKYFITMLTIIQNITLHTYWL